MLANQIGVNIEGSLHRFPGLVQPFCSPIHVSQIAVATGQEFLIVEHSLVRADQLFQDGDRCPLAAVRRASRMAIDALYSLSASSNRDTFLYTKPRLWWLTARFL